ncbi:MAG: ATP-binding protein [Thermoanaerobaculia bacterium]
MATVKKAGNLPSVPRFFRPPSTHYFLFGPRGTGKSTWLREEYADALWIDLLRPEVHRQYAARPERLRELVAGNPDRPVVVVDEVQKAPVLLDVVHDLIERRAGPRFILTGSSSRKLKREGVDLLAGRALLRSLHPFMAAELGDRFRLDSALARGLVPLVWSSREPEEVLEAYVALYLREEVQMEGLVRRFEGFARFLEAVSFSHAAVLNVSEVARECQVGRTTVEGYLEILEDLLLAFRIPIFTKRAKRGLTAHPKFFWFDAGVFVATRPAGPLDRPEEIGGAALEGLIAQHLRAWIDYSGEGFALSFWRTRAGAEVDFVLYGRHGFWAIEVKHSATIRPADLRGLKAFREDYPEAELRLLYRGEEARVVDGIRCLPCEDFLRALIPGRPLP